MRFFLLLFFISASSFAQKEKIYRNRIQLNALNHTPYVGVSYARSFWFPKQDTLKSHFEAGGGVGWMPVIFSDAISLPLSASHQISFLIDRRLVSFMVGYAGIFVPKDRGMQSKSVYTPNPYLGIRFTLYDVSLGFNYNSYFYSIENQRIVNENDLVRHISSKVAFYGGAYLSFSF